MWDVVWTDPDKELVGEHRAKKVNDEAKQKKKPKSRSGRASISTTSSRSSIETPFSLFRGRGLKRINAPSTQPGMASSISSGLSSPSIASTRSPLSHTFEEGGPQSPEPAPTSILDRHAGSSSSVSPASGRLVESASGISRSTSNDVDSIFSNSIADTTTTSSTDDAAEDESMTESERMRSIIQILEETVPNTVRSSICQSLSANQPGLDHAVNTLHQEKFRAGEFSTPPMSPTHSARQSLSRFSLDPPASPAFLVPPLKSPLRMFAPKRPAPEMLNSKDGWKPSDQHNPTPPGSRESMSHTFTQEPFQTRSCSESILLGGATTLEEKISKMATTGVKEQASILHGLWTKTNRQGTMSLRGDSKEALEMKRWMLSAMHNLDFQATIKKGQVSKEPLVTAEMVLILHESWAVVTYIAALHRSKQHYDLSLTARSYNNLPNVRNIPVTSLSANDFPIAPRILETVYSLSLPSQCPLDALSGVVRSVARCLKVGGNFNLTLIDPLPRAGTMGPRMRAWIEESLLQNLAKESRCMSPSTLFPQLLGEAGLRSKGSTLTTTKFFAMPQSARSLEEEPDTEMERLLAESEVKAEVRSLVGRMLWMEVWGAHITTDKWWWEEEACVRECLELGTFWEYHTIKGVKGEER